MKCPYCGNPDTKVIDSRPAEDGSSIRRRRACDICGKRFTTYEKIETIPLIIIKKDNNREQYSRQKIENGIIRADTRRNSRKRRSRRRTNQHKLSVLVITGVIFLMTALVVVGGISLRAKEKSYLAQETELKKQIDEEKARSQEIDDMEAYVGTDEYVEEIAKEKLGLVNENEIILKAK